MTFNISQTTSTTSSASGTSLTKPSQTARTRSARNRLMSWRSNRTGRSYWTTRVWPRFPSSTLRPGASESPWPFTTIRAWSKCRPATPSARRRVARSACSRRAARRGRGSWRTSTTQCLAWCSTCSGRQRTTRLAPPCQPPAASWSAHPPRPAPPRPSRPRSCPAAERSHFHLLSLHPAFLCFQSNWACSYKFIIVKIKFEITLYKKSVHFNLAKLIDSHTNLLILHDVFITVVYFVLNWNFILFDCKYTNSNKYIMKH